MMTPSPTLLRSIRLELSGRFSDARSQIPLSAKRRRLPGAVAALFQSCGHTRGRHRSRGGLNLALYKPANIAHGDSEVILSLQVDPELRRVAEITAET